MPTDADPTFVVTRKTTWENRVWASGQVVTRADFPAGQAGDDLFRDLQTVGVLKPAPKE